MAVKGTDLVKLMPKRTGCKECGFPTCFAFAMKLATGGVDVDACPYLSEEAKEKIRDMLAPPIRPVTIGTGDRALLIGEEEVVYRHEKTFFHQPGFAILIKDTEEDGEVERKAKAAEEMSFIRIGRTLRPDMVALMSEAQDGGNFASLVERVAGMVTVPIILMADDPKVLLAGLEACGADRRPLLYAVTKENIDALLPKLKEAGVPVAVKASSVEELVPLTERLKEEGIQDLVLDSGTRKLWEAIRDQILIRRAALKQEFKPLGYPTIAFPCFMADDLKREVTIAAAFLNRYAGIIVLSDFKEEYLYPLLTQRMNIYSDPRVPMTVEAKIYEINGPDENAPVLVTTNFALTYFAVASETEATKIPAFLAVPDTEGLCVLAAWSTGKFGGEAIGEFIKKSGIEEKVKKKVVVIPGLVARIMGELEDELPGWKVVVGPRDATGLSSFLPELAQKA